MNKVPIKKNKSVTNVFALFAEYGFVLIHYKQTQQHLKRTKQNEKKVQVIHHFS